MAEQLIHMPHVRKVESSIPKNWLKLAQHCKRFTIASTFMQVAVLSWCYDAEMGTINLLHASAYTASLMKGLVWLVLGMATSEFRILRNWFLF